MELITIEEVKNRLENGENFCFIDVREVWEYEEDNIGAQNIPLAEIPNKINDLADLKESEIVIHCKSGNRASQAQMYLKQQGFQEVINMKGGIEAFRAAGY